MAASMVRRSVASLLLAGAVASAQSASCAADLADVAVAEVSLLQHKTELSSDTNQYRALLEKMARLEPRMESEALHAEEPGRAGAILALQQSSVISAESLASLAIPADHESLRREAKAAAAAACTPGERLVFIGILSAPDNQYRRNIMRQIFLNDFRQAGYDECVHMKFIIGHAEFTTARQGQVATKEQLEREYMLEAESRQFGDVMRVTVPESYKTLPDKVLSILSASLLHNYEFVAKVDDDCLPDLTVMLPMIKGFSPDSFLYAGRYLWTHPGYPFQVGADGQFNKYFGGPTYLLSSGLARQIVVQDADRTNEFVAYGSKSEDMDMGKWVELAQQLSGRNATWMMGHLSYDMCGRGGCAKAGYVKS